MFRGIPSLIACTLLLLLRPGRGHAVPPPASRSPEATQRLLGDRAGLLMAADPVTGQLLLRIDRRTRGGGLPIGSLLKPFLFLAWNQLEHRSRSVAVCRPGGPPHCWLRTGHGRVPADRALEVSCNQAFREFARVTPVDEYLTVLSGYGLDLAQNLPPPPARYEAMFGRGHALRFDPQTVLEAYVGLFGPTRFRVDSRRPVYLGASPRYPGLRRLWSGLLRAGKAGTGRAARRHFTAASLACKTGTTGRLDADGLPLEQGTSGWFVAAAPAEAPKVVILVYLEDGTGSQDAAPLGGRLLASLWDQVKTSTRR